MKRIVDMEEKEEELAWSSLASVIYAVHSTPLYDSCVIMLMMMATIVEMMTNKNVDEEEEEKGRRG